VKRTPEHAIVFADLTGGRNDTDPPLSLPAHQAVEMLNVDQKDTTFARKRGGASAVTETGGTAFSSGIQTLARWVPGASEAAAEFWGIDGAATPIVKRMTGGTSFANVTVDDAIATKPQEVVAVPLNGKLFLFYDSAEDRGHVYDPNLSSARVRRMSFVDPTTAPTVADTGAGAYAAVLRYYRIRWIQVSGSKLIRRSEPSDSVSFTPSGAGTAARVTRPTAPGEGETHWELEWSPDNSRWHPYAGFSNGFQIAIATTTQDDNDDAATNNARGVADEVGLYKPFPSVKYATTDGNRILGAGAWESSGTNSGGLTARIWFTPVLGSSDKGDDERYVNTTTQKNHVDLNENDGGAITGLGGPINGTPYAFKYRQVWRLRVTGDVAAPYLPRKLRDDIGCISHKSIALGEDQTGRAALYFLSHRGPYRVTFDGAIEYLGRDNEVTWRSMNLAAATVVTHSVYYPDLHQWWVWIATGSSDDPDVKMVFDVQKGFPDSHGQIRGGWYKHTGPSAAARCSCLMSNTLGATMSRDLKPYIGRSSGTAIWKLDTSDLDDAGTDVQAYVKSRPTLTYSELGRKLGMGEPYLLAKVLTGVTVTLTSDRDFGSETRTHTALLTASGSETRVVKKFEGGEVGEADVIQVQIGDGSAQEGAWSFDALVVPTRPQEQK
jgi:hypothetical protein